MALCRVHPITTSSLGVIVIIIIISTVVSAIGAAKVDIATHQTLRGMENLGNDKKFHARFVARVGNPFQVLHGKIVNRRNAKFEYGAGAPFKGGLVGAALSEDGDDGEFACVGEVLDHGA